MSAELGSRFSRTGKEVPEKTKDLVRGHTLKEEADAKRILCDPSSISSGDVEAYKKERLDYVASLASTNLSFGVSVMPPSFLVDPEAVPREAERQKNLTPEQLANEILESARTKASNWKLKLNA